MAINPETLPVRRASELEIRPQEESWLIQQLWGRAAVGIIGGSPKTCKSWLGLDMAVSISSATPCLGRFAVQARGPTLVYLAEDALSMVRARLDALCGHRRLDIRGLDLHAITAPSLRLDRERDRQRLKATLEQLKPRMLLLDPLVRLHHPGREQCGGYLQAARLPAGDATHLRHGHRAGPPRQQETPRPTGPGPTRQLGPARLWRFQRLSGAQTKPTGPDPGTPCRQGAQSHRPETGLHAGRGAHPPRSSLRDLAPIPRPHSPNGRCWYCRMPPSPCPASFCATH